jgi:hypothetical protein
LAQNTRLSRTKISKRPPRRQLAEEVKGCVLFRGTSPFVPAGSDAQFVAIMTFHSENRKTGDMAQIWLLAENESPLDARKLGLYRIVCGDCPVVSCCYVNLAHRPRTVYEGYQAGQYPDYAPNLHEAAVVEKGVRFGAYGDPVLLPLWLVQRLVRASGGRWTGYTHQWRRAEYQSFREFFMASVETEEDAALAESMGWRWYMVTTKPSIQGAVMCPHQNTQLDRLVLCNTCWACNGAQRPVGARQRVNIIASPTGHNHAAARWRNHVENKR